MLRTVVEIPPDARYFSRGRFRLWALRRFGAEFTYRQVADVIGWDERSVSYAMRGMTSPTLENYLRAIAFAELPVDAWISNLTELEYEPPDYPPLER